MRKIGENECHDEKINREDPDWSLIYSYFTALLNTDERPHLGQIGRCRFIFTPFCCVGYFLLSVTRTGSVAGLKRARSEDF